MPSPLRDLVINRLIVVIRCEASISPRIPRAVHAFIRHRKRICRPLSDSADIGKFRKLCEHASLSLAQTPITIGNRQVTLAWTRDERPVCFTLGSHNPESDLTFA